MDRAGNIMAAGASYLMVREKDLPENELTALCRQAAAVVSKYGGRLIVNSSLSAALEAGAWGLQLPFEMFMDEQKNVLGKGLNVGVSVHSLQEALAAEQAGADRVLAGHIFETDCKSGLPDRGLNFLSKIVRALNIPVWAVGGIMPENINQVFQAGAETACIRSALLKCADPSAMVSKYLKSAASEE